MKLTRKNPKLERVMEELNKEELTRTRAMVSAQSTLCKGFGGDITLCAVLCEQMVCKEFAHQGPKWPKCMLIKCSGFSGEPGGCGPFEVVSIK